MQRLNLSAKLVFIALVVFFILRCVLLIVHDEYFSSLSLIEQLEAIVIGLRFDLSIILAVFAAPLLMLNMPLAFCESRWWVRLWSWLMYPLVIMLTFLLVADVIFFEHVKRHIGNELVQVSADTGYILHAIKTEYKLEFAAFVLLVIVVGWIWGFLLPRVSAASGFRTRTVSFIVLFFVVVVIGRGGVTGKPLNVIDAYAYGDPVFGNLVLNGAFTSIHASRKSKPIVDYRFLDQDELKAAGLSTGVFNIDQEIPFEKQYQSTRSDKPNLIFVLLESFSFKYIDALAGNGYGVTPNLDELVEQSISYTNFYAAAQRSIQGIQATLTGVPVLQGLPYLGTGLEVSNISKLGFIAKQNGYRSIFQRSAPRHSYRVNSIAPAVGFDEYYGLSDYELIKDYPNPDAAPFGWDYDAFMDFADRLENINEPFLGYFFTASTHGPFPPVPQDLVKYPEEPDSENGFLNTLHYADWSLGQFMKRAEQAEWFDNTIFIFTADHTLGAFSNDGFAERFHIPFLIYGPKFFEPAQVHRVGSQLDVFPTIIDLLGFEQPFSAFGESLMRKNSEIALVWEGDVMGVITDKGYLRHSLRNRLGQGSFGEEMSTEYFDSLERNLLGLTQASYSAILDNRWAK